MLTAKQKQDWVEALRNGNYRQTKIHQEGFWQLKGPNGYCCLGVLAELNGWDVTGLNLDKVGSKNLAKDPAKDPANLSAFGRLDFVGLPPHPKGGSLARMNDSGVPFTEIADFLEKYLPTEG